MTTDQEQMREAFEQFLVARPECIELYLIREKDGEYQFRDTKIAWVSWQAAWSARVQPVNSSEEDIDFSIREGDTVFSKTWTLTPLIVESVNWALRAVALRLGTGGIVVWPVAGLKKSEVKGQPQPTEGAAAEPIEYVKEYCCCGECGTDGTFNAPLADAIKAAKLEVLANPPPLTWTKQSPPTDSVPYDHVIAETKFGRILITWKGWKDHPAPCVDEHPVAGYFYAGDDLEDAKRAAENAFFEALADELRGKV